MAKAYRSLSVVYRTCGHLVQGEAMLKRSVLLFQAVGAAPQVELVQGWLEGLRQSD